MDLNGPNEYNTLRVARLVHSFVCRKVNCKDRTDLFGW